MPHYIAATALHLVLERDHNDIIWTMSDTAEGALAQADAIGPNGEFDILEATPRLALRIEFFGDDHRTSWTRRPNGIADMCGFTQPARDALNAAGFEDLDDEDACAQIADYCFTEAEAYRNEHGMSTAAEAFENWGGAKGIAHEYIGGPDDAWRPANLLAHDEIKREVVRTVAEHYEMTIAEETRTI